MRNPQRSVEPPVRRDRGRSPLRGDDRRPGSKALGGRDARAPLRSRPRDAPRGSGRPVGRSALERARARLHLQHARPGQGHRRPAAQLPAPDGRAPPRQRGPGESVARCSDACARPLRPVARLLPPQGATARPRDPRRLRPLCAARRSRGSAQLRRGRGHLSPGAYRDFSPRMRGGRALSSTSRDRRRAPDGKRGGASRASTVPSVILRAAELHQQPARRDDGAHDSVTACTQSLAARQGLFEQDTPLTTAETASVFGEMLVFRHLMREESDPRSVSRSCVGSSRTRSRRCSARWR